MKRKLLLIILAIVSTIIIVAVVSSIAKPTENKLVMHASKWNASQENYVDVWGNYTDLSGDQQIAETVSNSSSNQQMEIPESMTDWAKGILGGQTSKTIVVRIGSDFYTVIIKYEATISKRSP